MRLLLSALFSIAVVSSPVSTRAQQPIAPFSDDERSKEPYVIEHLQNNVHFEADGKGYRDLTVRIKVKSESAVRDWGTVIYPFASSFESLEVLYARVRKPDGSVIETPAADIQELDSAVSREAPMYTDQREKHIPIKALSVGDLLEINARWTVRDPIAPNHFWFDHSFFKEGTCLKEILQIDVPKNVPIKLRNSDPQPSVRDEGPRRFYTFEASNTKRPDESKIPIWQKNYHGAPPPDVQISSFSSWSEVGDWFGTLMRPKLTVTPELRTKSEELTKGKVTEEEKIRVLYDFVSSRFRYIGIDLGLSRYRPHTAFEVLSNRYGDCKDKHTLFAALLQALGISANAVLISSQFKIDSNFPSPSLFDHVITAIPMGETFLFLDTTPEVAPFGLILASLRGRQALVVSSTAAARLVNTPANLSVPNQEVFRVDSSIDTKGALDAKMHIEERGDLEVGLRAAYRSTPQNRWQELTQNLAGRMGFGGTVSDVSVAQPEDTTHPFWISFSYHRADFPDWKTHRILLPSPPFFIAELSDEEKASEEALPLGGPQEVTYQTTIKFPPGFSPVLPENIERKTGFAQFSATYSLEKDTLHGTLRFITLQNEIPGTERSAFGSLAKLIDETQRRYIFVKGNFPDNLAATTFFASMPTAMVIPSLEQALAADPDNDDVLVRLTAAYRKAGRAADAVGILQKAIKGHSDAPAHLSLALGLCYLDLSETDKAVDEFKKFVGSDAEPEELNDVAYALANANTHLPEALDYSMRAVSALSSLTMDIDPEQTKPADFALMSGLAANWDTLGWVMYRRGDFAGAESFLAAAWDLVQSSTIGEHLVQAYEKLGKKQKAAAICNMAYAALFPDAEAQLKKRLSEEMNRLHPFIKKTGVRNGPTYIDGHVALTDLRMFQVPFQGKFPGKSASAQFLISITNGPKVESAIFISGAEELRGASASLSRLNYPQSFPDGTLTRIIRKATLNCNVYSRSCTVILMPTDEAAVVTPKFPLVMQPPPGS